MLRLQRRGYALKRGKYISARAPGQERFTRLKTLGADYAEDALTARMAGRARPLTPTKAARRQGQPAHRYPEQHQGPAERGLPPLGDHRESETHRRDQQLPDGARHRQHGGADGALRAASASAARLKAELRETGARIEELTLKMKHVAAYRQLKPIYDRYQASKDKEKFLRGYEREIILFEAAARGVQAPGSRALPSAERCRRKWMRSPPGGGATAERQKARREEQDYAAVRRNVEEFLSPPRQAPARQKDMELE